MKRGICVKLVTAAFVLALGSNLLADVSATVTSVQQNWPWDTRVRVTYEVSGGVCDVTPSVVFQGIDSVIKIQQSTNLSFSTGAEYSLKGDICAVGPGTHALEFDAAKLAFPTNVTKPAAMKGLSVRLDAKETSFRKFLVVDLSSKPYGVSWLDDVPSGGWTTEYKTTKLVFARVPVYGGTTFELGAPTNELGYVAGYEASRSATLTNDFYMGIFEVTQKQYELVMGAAPSGIATANVADDKPATMTTYIHFVGAAQDSGGYGWPLTSAVAPESFVGVLRANAALPACFVAGYKFHLPTDAQWEFACRGGVTTTWHNGTDFSLTYDASKTGNPSQFDENLERIAWYAHNSGGVLQTVGQKLPNAYGIYDMIGNATEWCVNYSLAEAYSGGVEPKGNRAYSTANAPLRSLRGGNYSNYLFARTTFTKYGDINATLGGGEYYGIITQRPAFHVRASWTDKHDFISARIAIAYTNLAE